MMHKILLIIILFLLMIETALGDDYFYEKKLSQALEAITKDSNLTKVGCSNFNNSEFHYKNCTGFLLSMMAYSRVIREHVFMLQKRGVDAKEWMERRKEHFAPMKLDTSRLFLYNTKGTVVVDYEFFEDSVVILQIYPLIYTEEENAEIWAIANIYSDTIDIIYLSCQNFITEQAFAIYLKEFGK